MFDINSNLIKVILPAITSLIAVIWGFYKVLKLAIEKNLVDNPNARKLQKVPIPVMGGVAVFFGIVCSGLLSSCLFDCTQLFPIYVAMVLMLFIGILDDLMGLTPLSRFLIEVLAILALIFGGGGCVDSLHGLWGIQDFSWWIGVPLTIFACVGIINAVNMIDGVNGLSSGYCMVCAAMFGFALYQGGDVPNAALCFSIAVGLCPFIAHNVFGRTSRMFLGDGGTMVMGVMMSWCVIQVLRHDTVARWSVLSDRGMGLVALVFAILSIPVMDTLRVMTMRILHGNNPFLPDKTHLHHILFKYSCSHLVTTLTEIILNFLVVLIWNIAYKCNASVELQLYIVLAAAGFFVWGTYFYMYGQDCQNTSSAAFMRKWLYRMRQEDSGWWDRFQHYVDTPRRFSKSGLEERKEA